MNLHPFVFINNWHNDIVKEIDKHKGRFTRRDYKKYKLDLLLRVAKRVASFSVDCSECQNFQIEIKKHAENLDKLVQSSKEESKSYFRTIDNVIKHLQEHHKLIVEYQNLGIWFIIGLSIGAYLDDKAKKDGMVI